MSEENKPRQKPTQPQRTPRDGQQAPRDGPPPAQQAPRDWPPPAQQAPRDWPPPAQQAPRVVGQRSPRYAKIDQEVSPLRISLMILGGIFLGVAVVGLILTFGSLLSLSSALW